MMSETTEAKIVTRRLFFVHVMNSVSQSRRE